MLLNTVTTGIHMLQRLIYVARQYSNSQTFNVKLKPDGSVFSPFGPAVEIFSYTEQGKCLRCVKYTSIRQCSMFMADAANDPRKVSQTPFPQQGY